MWPCKRQKVNINCTPFNFSNHISSMFDYEASMGKKCVKNELTGRTATISRAILFNTVCRLSLILNWEWYFNQTFFLCLLCMYWCQTAFPPLKVSALVLTQAASGLCAAGTWFHEASLLLCEGVTRSRAGQAEAGVQRGGGANQARKRGEPS